MMQCLYLHISWFHALETFHAYSNHHAVSNLSNWKKGDPSTDLIKLETSFTTSTFKSSTSLKNLIKGPTRFLIVYPAPII